MNNFFKTEKGKKQTASAFDDIYNGIYVPKRYKNTVMRHLILNYSKNINGFAPPLFLAIQGMKGEGKSFMIEKLCEYYSISYIPVSGAELCGGLEGDSSRRIMEVYEKACLDACYDKKLSCIVIDDFHKSIADEQNENISKTVNTGILVGRLMNLADNPYVSNVRVPIILTGNNFTSIYTALTRHSRMDFFDWEPTLEEKKKIVYHMFKSFYPNISIQVTNKLVDEYPNNYIAFFKSVIQNVFIGNIDSVVDAFHENRNNVNLDNVTGLVAKNLEVNLDISLKQIMSVAKKQNESKAKKFD